MDTEIVTYGTTGSAETQFQHTIATSLALDDLLARLKTAIVAADLWVLHEIDPQMLLQRGGYRIGAARQILFFHPRFVARMMASDPAALLEAPLKFALIAGEGGTILRWFDPVPLFARYEREPLTAIGEELSALCRSIAQAAVGDRP